jgi:hypothetical protein
MALHISGAIGKKEGPFRGATDTSSGTQFPTSSAVCSSSILNTEQFSPSLATACVSLRTDVNNPPALREMDAVKTDTFNELPPIGLLFF